MYLFDLYKLFEIFHMLLKQYLQSFYAHGRLVHERFIRWTIYVLPIIIYRLIQEAAEMVFGVSDAHEEIVRLQESPMATVTYHFRVRVVFWKLIGRRTGEQPFALGFAQPSKLANNRLLCSANTRLSCRPGRRGLL